MRDLVHTLHETDHNAQARISEIALRNQDQAYSSGVPSLTSEDTFQFVPQFGLNVLENVFETEQGPVLHQYAEIALSSVAALSEALPVLPETAVGEVREWLIHSGG
jgi:hypothetical protein